MKCPSYPEQAATLEIGRRGPDGTIVFHATPMARRPTDRVRSAQVRIDIDADGRYAGPCVTSACANWDGACQLGRRIATHDDGMGVPCAIAGECRWYAENGPSACGGCRHVVYRNDRAS